MTALESGPESGTLTCVYCDRAMREILTDRVHDANAMAWFQCEGCGWEVMVPRPPEPAESKGLPA